MTRVLTVDELLEKLSNVKKSALPSTKTGMRQALRNVKGQAMRNCTPGQSPYPKAPYSDDNDPHRDPVHMRDSMGTRVEVDGTRVRGIIGNYKPYSHWVHDGTRRMPPRPFIVDAIKEKQLETRAILSDAIEIGVLSAWDGDLFGGGLGQAGGSIPTMPDEGDEE